MNQNTQQAVRIITRAIKSTLLNPKTVPIVMGIAPTLAAAAVTPNLDGSIVSGTASISTQGNVTTITQTSNKVIIDFQQFSIGADEILQFIQPSSSAIALNRVVGGQSSLIQGKLLANGQVFLINPNGITFATTAKIDVSGIIATTLNITNGDFLENRLAFSKIPRSQDGQVLNQGQINGTNFVVLAGDFAENKGTVTAQLGQSILASGSRMSLDLQGDGLINFSVDAASVSDLAGVSNAGTILGNTVMMTAKVSQDLVSTVVNNSGTVIANEIVDRNGEIFLLGEGGSVNNNGSLNTFAESLTTGSVNISSTHNIQAGNISAPNITISGNTVNLDGKVSTTANDLNVSASGSIHAFSSISSARSVNLSSKLDIQINGSINAAEQVVIQGNSVNILGNLNVIERGDINITAANNINIEGLFNSANNINISGKNIKVSARFKSGQSISIAATDSSQPQPDNNLPTGGTVNISGDFSASSSLNIFAGQKVNISGTFNANNSSVSVHSRTIELSGDTLLSSQNGNGVAFLAENIFGSHNLTINAKSSLRGGESFVDLGFANNNQKVVVNVGSVDLTGDVIFINEITTEGDQLFHGNTFTMGDLTSQNGNIILDKELVLFFDSTLTTKGGGNILVSSINEVSGDLIFGNTRGPITQDSLGAPILLSLNAGSGNISVGDLGTNLFGTFNDEKISQQDTQVKTTRLLSDAQPEINSPFDPRFDSTFARGFGQINLVGNQVKLGTAIAEGDIFISSKQALQVNRDLVSNFGNIELQTAGLFSLLSKTSISANSISIKSSDSLINGKLISNNFQFNTLATPDPVVDDSAILQEVVTATIITTPETTTTTSITSEASPTDSSSTDLASGDINDSEAELQAQILSEEDPTTIQEATAAGEEEVVEIIEDIKALPLIDNAVSNNTACVP
ncbi:MAG: filamentous hemagglutinin N-terminal domain-containing protein [Methylococcales bacterium]|mgnify:FL=1|nr:filamentous hemagglutinin N-terminal domain-containing protein [Methylococcales bacterium]MBT7442813.1 filamentous hemagglutinin N-terminal domain-containing protein [Methylococcales bacterium]